MSVRDAVVDDLTEDVCAKCGTRYELTRPSSLYMDGQHWGEILCTDCAAPVGEETA